MGRTCMEKMIRIGFPRQSITGGPGIFLDRLRKSLVNEKLAIARTSLLPFYDIGLFNSVAKNYYNKPYVLRLDGIYYSQTKTKPSFYELNKPIHSSIEGASGVIYQSQFSKTLVESYFGKQRLPSTIITNGSPLMIGGDKQSIQRELGIPQNRFYLITAATWRRHKRLPEIIKLVEHLHNIDNRFALLIVGKVASPSNRPFILYTNHIKPKNVYKYYQAADLYVHLSWLDNCPNTVIEAIACGLPVVCSNQGGTKEIIQNNKAGIVSECDQEVNYFEVDLDTPPIPDYEVLIKDILNISEHIEAYKKKTIFTKINIKYVAKKYANFISALDLYK